MKVGTLSDKLARVLFIYWNTTHTTTGIFPAELMFGRRLQSWFDLIKPSLEAHFEHKQLQQKRWQDQHAHVHVFSTRDKVYAKKFRPGQEWLPRTITLITGPVSYTVMWKLVMAGPWDGTRTTFVSIQVHCCLLPSPPQWATTHLL